MSCSCFSCTLNPSANHCIYKGQRSVPVVAISEKKTRHYKPSHIRRRCPELSELDQIILRSVLNRDRYTLGKHDVMDKRRDEIHEFMESIHVSWLEAQDMLWNAYCGRLVNLFLDRTEN